MPIATAAGLAPAEDGPRRRGGSRACRASTSCSRPGADPASVEVALERALTIEPYLLSSPQDVADVAPRVHGGRALDDGAARRDQPVRGGVRHPQHDRDDRDRARPRARAAARRRRHPLAGRRASSSPRALLLGALGSALGAAAGVLLAQVAAAWLRTAGGVTLDGPEITPPILVAAVGAGVVITLVASLEPARRAGAVSPVEALRTRSDAAAGVRAHTSWLLVVMAVVGVLAALLRARAGRLGVAVRAHDRRLHRPARGRPRDARAAGSARPGRGPPVLRRAAPGGAARARRDRARPGANHDHGRGARRGPRDGRRAGRRGRQRPRPPRPPGSPTSCRATRSSRPSRPRRSAATATDPRSRRSTAWRGRRPIASFDLAFDGTRLDAVAIRGADFDGRRPADVHRRRPDGRAGGDRRRRIGDPARLAGAADGRRGRGFDRRGDRRRARRARGRRARRSLVPGRRGRGGAGRLARRHRPLRASGAPTPGSSATSPGERPSPPRRSTTSRRSWP